MLGSRTRRRRGIEGGGGLRGIGGKQKQESKGEERPDDSCMSKRRNQLGKSWERKKRRGKLKTVEEQKRGEEK